MSCLAGCSTSPSCSSIIAVVRFSASLILHGSFPIICMGLQAASPVHSLLSKIGADVHTPPAYLHSSPSSHLSQSDTCSLPALKSFCTLAFKLHRVCCLPPVRVVVAYPYSSRST